MRTKVLVIDDEKTICDGIEEALSDQFQILKANSGHEGLAIAKKENPDVILLDIMMPGIDGFSTCAALRECEPIKKVPVIMLTALRDSSDRIKAFKSGADDFIGKPFVIEELIARIEAKIRRRDLDHLNPSSAAEMRCGNLVFNLDSLEVSVEGEHIKLTLLETNLLKFFVQNKGKLLSRQQILDAVWKTPETPTRVLDWHILCLRKKLVHFDHKIGTVYGGGYILKPGKHESAPPQRSSRQTTTP